MKYSLLLFTLLLFVGCKDKSTNSSNSPLIEVGEYNGIFTFTENDYTSTSNVKFTFTDTIYTCIPQKAYMPPTGGGKYEYQKDKIVLTDMVMHTAEFDWTLILGGEFNYSKSGNTIILIQEDKNRNRFRKIELTKSN